MDLEKLEGTELFFKRRHKFPEMQRIDVFYFKDHKTLKWWISVSVEALLADNSNNALLQQD